MPLPEVVELLPKTFRPYTTNSKSIRTEAVLVNLVLLTPDPNQLPDLVLDPGILNLPDLLLLINQHRKRSPMQSLLTSPLRILFIIPIVNNPVMIIKIMIVTVTTTTTLPIANPIKERHPTVIRRPMLPTWPI